MSQSQISLRVLTLQQLDDEYAETVRRLEEIAFRFRAGQLSPREGSELMIKQQVVTSLMGLLLREYSRRSGQITPGLLDGPHQVVTELRVTEDRTEDLWPTVVQRRVY